MIRSCNRVNWSYYKISGYGDANFDESNFLIEKGDWYELLAFFSILYSKWQTMIDEALTIENYVNMRLNEGWI